MRPGHFQNNIIEAVGSCVCSTTVCHSETISISPSLVQMAPHSLAIYASGLYIMV